MLVKEFFDQNEVEGFQTFMKNYNEIEYQKSFSSWSGMKRSRYTEGLVSAYDLLSELANASVEVMNDFNDFMKEYGSLKVVSEKGDNTCNYNGYLDHYLNFNVLELENDQVLISLAVGTSLDPRYSYTKSVLMLFDDEYNFLDVLSQNFGLVDFEVKVKEETFSANFDASALSEYGMLTLVNDKTGEEVFYDEVLMDSTDSDDIKTTVEEMLESKVKIENLCYFWDALC